MGNNNSLVVKQCEYVFPPTNMNYKEDDLLIIRRITTLLYLSINAYMKPPCTFIWSVKNKSAYVKSFHCVRCSDESNNYSIDAYITEYFNCELKCNGEIIEDKERLIIILDSILSRYITRMVDEERFNIKIYRPNLEGYKISTLLAKIWDIIWNKYEGEISEDIGEIEWRWFSDGLIVDNIVTKEYSFYFSTRSRFTVITPDREYTIHNDRIEINERQIKSRGMLYDVEEYLHCLIDWIDRSDTNYLFISLYDNWVLEKEEYDSYIQWLPAEILEDVVNITH